MGQAVLCIAIAGCLWAGVGVILSLAMRREASLPALFLVAAVVGLALRWLLFPDVARLGRAESVPRLGDLVPVMLAGGLFGASGIMLLQEAMGRGHQGMTWTIGQSALAVPFLAGVFVFGEEAAGGRVAGVGLILACLLLFGVARRKEANAEALQGRYPDPADAPPADTDTAGSQRMVGTAESEEPEGPEGMDGSGRGGAAATAGPVAAAFRIGAYPLALIAFCFIGLQQTFCTVPSHWDGWRDVAGLRQPLVASGAFLVFAGRAAWVRPRPDRAAVMLGLILACISVLAENLLFRGLDGLALVGRVSIGFPLAISICIIGFALFRGVLMRERFTRLHLLGLGCGVAGAVLVAG